MPAPRDLIPRAGRPARSGRVIVVQPVIRMMPHTQGDSLRTATTPWILIFESYRSAGSVPADRQLRGKPGLATLLCTRDIHLCEITSLPPVSCAIESHLKIRWSPAAP
jgi:hypothetical protein